MKKISFQKIFCFVSIIFILCCCGFYGTRLVKYYKIYNPKSESGNGEISIAASITSKIPLVIEGSGAYRISGNTIYKGDNTDNYVLYSNQLWRIVKIKSDNTIELILDDYINILPWNNSYSKYSKSNIIEYLNDVFLQSLNQDLLAKTTICEDDIADTSSLSCEKINVDNYVSLLDISDYLNSIADSKTYISEGTDKIWLANTNEKNKKIWHTSGSSLTYSDSDSNYLVKPVVTISNKATLKYGTGTKEEPYVIKDNSTSIKAGSYIKLGNDLWIAYNVDKEVVKMQRAELVSTKKPFSSSANAYTLDTSLAKYLNDTYYNSLSYKDKLVKTDWYTGKFDSSYKSVKDSKVNAYVGLLNRYDLKYNSSLINYYLSTPSTNKVYIYNSVLAESSVTVSRQIRPTIAISSKTKFKGNGTEKEPFTLEA